MSRVHVFNGLDGDSGRYLFPPMSDEALAARAMLQARSSERPPEAVKTCRGVEAGVDPQRLEEAGWGLVMAAGAEERFAARSGGGPGLRSSLGALCDLRAEEAGALYRDNLSRSAPLVYKRGERASVFLRRYGVHSENAVSPREMPYYLLLVGGPEEIPYSVQTDLDVRYAVGRISFDRAEEYAAYAAAVKAASEGATRRERQVAFFAAENAPGDATVHTARDLVPPLMRKLAERRTGWQIDARLGPQADRAALAGLLRGAERRPAFLFTASHGAGFPGRPQKQEALQGALVCQDWKGPGTPLAREHFFAAEDLGDDAQVAGLVALLFACYSAGTPEFDSFERDAFNDPPRIAERPLVSRLPQRLLSHPRGAALAVIGHVDRAWTSSFRGGTGAPNVTVYSDLLHNLLAGSRLGAAMEGFANRYTALGAEMWTLGDLARQGDPTLTAEEFSETLLATNDARNFVLFGDPAVRLAVGD